MKTTEIRGKVIGKINQTTDDELLMDISKLVNESFVDPDVYRLSDGHKTAIETALGQVENGVLNQRPIQERN